jgi:CheY-like chemotaxis protein
MKPHILVVEDNWLNAELLRDWLELRDYLVVAAHDLAQARAAIDSTRFDVILLDIRLGDEDGATLAAWIRRQPLHRNIPVIAVTAHALPAEQKRVIQAGCTAYISKPIDFGRFGDLLARWLANSPNPAPPSSTASSSSTTHSPAPPQHSGQKAGPPSRL